MIHEFGVNDTWTLNVQSEMISDLIWKHLKKILNDSSEEGFY